MKALRRPVLRQIAGGLWGGQVRLDNDSRHFTASGDGIRDKENDMAIQEYMTVDPITVQANDSIWQALKMLQGHEIRHLPVIQGKRLVGIISDRDFRQVLPSSLAMPEEQGQFRAWGTQVKVGEIMTRKVVTVTPQTRTDKAAQLMVEHRIGCLPVLRGSTLVGIVTRMDLLRAMAEGDRPRAGAPKQASARRPKSRGKRRTSRAQGRKVRPS